MVIINKGASAPTKLKLKQGETKMKNNDKLKSLLQQVINKLQHKEIVLTKQQEHKLNTLLTWEKIISKLPFRIQNNCPYDTYGELEYFLEDVLKEVA